MLAGFVDRRRLSAILLIAAGIAIGIAIPPAILLSGASVALVTLRRGSVEGLIAGLAGWSVVAGLLLLAGQGPDANLLGMLGLLTAIVAMASVLRRFSALHLSIWLGIALAVGALSIFWLLVPDPAAFWRDGFVRLLDTLAAQMRESGNAGFDPSELRQLADAVQWRGFSGNVFGGLLLVACGSLFIGRSWHAKLANPGGFRLEFHRLRLYRPLALATAACFMLAALMDRDWLLNVAAILLLVWIIQGFAVIHGLVGILAGGGAWLVLAYLLCVAGLLSGNSLVLVVPLLGLVNEFFDVRAFAARSASK